MVCVDVGVVGERSVEYEQQVGFVHDLVCDWCAVAVEHVCGERVIVADLFFCFECCDHWCIELFGQRDYCGYVGVGIVAGDDHWVLGMFEQCQRLCERFGGC